MGETEYAGINYAPGRITNIDLETGIRYGVIPFQELGQVWFDESEPYYEEPCCPECGFPISDREEGTVCPQCKHEVEDGEFDFEEPTSFFIDNEEISAEQPNDNTDIWVLKSKYFTYAQFCSPCAPGACYLMSWLAEDARTDGNKAYCFGHDWFEDGKAPYPVFDVETGEEVKPNDDTE